MTKIIIFLNCCVCAAIMIIKIALTNHACGYNLVGFLQCMAAVAATERMFDCDLLVFILVTIVLEVTEEYSKINLVL